MKTRTFGKARKIGSVLAVTAAMGFGNCIAASAEPFTGQIMLTGTNFCPRGWVEANGQLISISTNTALFSLYGTTYGGDGRTTFGLPDLRGRVPIHEGTGPGLTPRKLGERGGTDQAEIAKGDTSVAVGPPYLALMYCVAVNGVFPSRN